MSRQTQSDGKIIKFPRDPPGQDSTYIVSGHSERETYRLATYERFPRTAPVNPTVLAQHGFFYTGYKDRVKCFSCGATVENWELHDDPKHIGWHGNDCEFVTFTDIRNVPLHHGGNPLPNRHTATDSNNPPPPPPPGPIKIPAGQLLMRGMDKEPNRNKTQQRGYVSSQQVPPSVVAATNAVENSGDFPLRMRQLSYEDSGSSQSFLTNHQFHNNTTSSTPLLPPRAIGQDVCGHNWEEVCEREENRKRGRELESQIVRLGFDERDIQAAVARQLQVHGSHFDSLETFLDAVLDAQESNAPTPSPASPILDVITADNDVTTAKQPQATRGRETDERELQELRYRGICKICLFRKATVVLLPCKHLACCLDCKPMVPKCPVCGQTVAETVDGQPC